MTLSEYHKRWYQENKGRIRQEQKDDWEKHPEKRDAYNKRRRELRAKKIAERGPVVKYYKSHHSSYDLFRGAWDRAKKRSVEFDLCIDDVIIPDKCPVFQTEFVKGTEYAASLDRIDSTKGYIRGNIQVISLKANMMKQNASKEELEIFARWILNQNKSNP